MSLKQLIRRSPGLRRALALPLAARRSLLSRRNQPLLDFLQRFETQVIDDVHVRVDEFEGDFVFGPRSHLLHRWLLFGKYEPELAGLFRSLITPGRDVIDVGANIGFFSVLGARHVGSGRVLAAEPTSSAFRRLAHNVAANGVADRVILYQGLVSAAESTTDINIVEGREEYSSIGVMEHPAIAGQPLTSERVQARPLDALVHDHGLHPSVMKVDVEGAEMMVFQGAQEVFRKHRPTVISELTPSLLERNGTSPAEIVAMFDRLNYDVKDPFDPRIRPGDVEFGDILAVPR